MSKKIHWQLFPKNKEIPEHLENVVNAFNFSLYKIDSEAHEHKSNAVLKAVSDQLELHGFRIEKSKLKDEKIKVPVLFGRNGLLEKSFDADAYNDNTKTVIEVEAGRAVVNNQFLKDLFQACMMHNVDNLVIAVRKVYRGRQDFESVLRFFDTLYASGRLKLPLSTILIIGY